MVKKGMSLLLIGLMVGSLAWAQPGERYILDVPYVPTPEVVVDAMLAMGQVTKDDILYDLGSGDGRIPIAAAVRFGTKGLGVDLDPARVREAKENAVKARVEDQVRFFEGDLFDVDLTEATVITLYLFPEVNMELRPRLMQLAPGTRVISHNYDMGDWVPDQVKKVDVPGGREHTVYLWKISAK